MNSDWAALPQHLLDSVLERVVLPVDYLRFSLVCMSWHCVAKGNKKLCAKMSRCHRPPPMLLIPSGKNGIWRLYNVMDDRLLNLQLDLGNRRFCGSSKGWLIVVEENLTITLINPFFRLKGRRKKKNSIIRLPKLDILDWFTVHHHYRVFKAAISADPILNTNDCTVAVIYEDMCQMAYIRLGKDRSWIHVDMNYTLIEEVAFIEDRNYAVDRYGRLLSVDITDSNSVVKIVADGMKQQPSTKSYLVAFNDTEFVMVRRYLFYEDGKRVTKGFRVFELDYNMRRWIAKKSLGDVALFIGDNSSVSVLASECKGCQSNCIYFNHDFDRIQWDPIRYGRHDFGVCDINNGNVLQPYCKSATTLMKKANQPPIWIVPSFQL